MIMTRLVVRVIVLFVCHSSQPVAVCCCCWTPDRMLSYCSTETHSTGSLWLIIDTHTPWRTPARLLLAQKTSTSMCEVSTCIIASITAAFQSNMALWGCGPLSFTDSICADKNGRMFARRHQLSGTRSYSRRDAMTLDCSALGSED